MICTRNLKTFTLLNQCTIFQTLYRYCSSLEKNRVATFKCGKLVSVFADLLRCKERRRHKDFMISYSVFSYCLAEVWKNSSSSQHGADDAIDVLIESHKSTQDDMKESGEVMRANGTDTKIFWTTGRWSDNNFENI